MSSLVDYTFLARLGSKSICVFRGLYDEYCRDVNGRAAQVTSKEPTTEDPIRRVGLVFSIDADQLQCVVEWSMNLDCISVETVTEASLQPFLDAEYQESKTVITNSDLTKVVETAL